MSWSFLHPNRLWLMLLVAAVGVLYAWSLRLRGKRAIRFTNIDLLDVVAPHQPGWRRYVVGALMFLALAIGVLGIAQPYRSEAVANDRSMIMVVLDVSLSMMADDVEPNRFEAAQAQAREFVEQVDESIEVGLVSFSMDVRVRVAPTLEREKVLNAIDRLELDEGTAIGDAIITTADAIADEFDEGSGSADDSDSEEPDDADSGSESGSDDSSGQGDSSATPLGDGENTPAAIVILTDGETIDGMTPGQEGALRAKEYGIPVYGIVFGTPNGVVTLDDPMTGETFSEPVPVKYEELDGAAEITGGKSYRAESPDALGDAYEDVRAQLEPALKVPEPLRVELTVRYLVAAFALTLIAFALSLWWLSGLT